MFREFYLQSKKYKDAMSDESSGSDFDDDEDPDKIEVPGELNVIQFSGIKLKFLAAILQNHIFRIIVILNPVYISYSY